MAKAIHQYVLQNLQDKTSNIRNVCIIAHVDHGKTSLADCLVAANGIISARMVGKIRYMDSRTDEQQRGITMKSSAIALYFKCDNEDYLINLVDSPGHVDFCGEVSTATRLCDSALLVVDVVEGVGPQTHAVMRQASKEGLRTILVLNKIDRLITELKLSPLEAYRKLNVVLEQVNSIAGEILLAEMIGKDDEEAISSGISHSAMEACEERVYFAPEKDNVIFASALDGWGFVVSDFARIHAQRTALSERKLASVLWADYYWDGKAKRPMKGALSSNRKPLFVHFILDNIWRIYESVMFANDTDQLTKICAHLDVRLTVRDLKHSDGRVRLNAIFDHWLPLATAILNSICRKTPPPNYAVDQTRLESLTGNSLESINESIRKDLLNCDRLGSTVVFVSKMIAVDAKDLPKNRRLILTLDELRKRKVEQMKAELKGVDHECVLNNGKADECTRNNKEPEFNDEDSDKNSSLTIEDLDESALVFLGFARIFSGTLCTGDTVHVLPSNYDAVEIKSKAIRVKIAQLYMFMGRELETIDRMSAGNLVGIAGLQDVVLNDATLSSTRNCPSLSPVQTYAEPIVRVSIEPNIPGQIDQLKRGLKLLNQADPCVRAFVQDTGELVLITSGEVHLERCIADLKERFSPQIDEILVSEPIIPFLETIVRRPKIDLVNEMIETAKSDRERIAKNDLIILSTANKKCTFEIRAVPLSLSIIATLEKHKDLVDILSDPAQNCPSYQHRKRIIAFRKQLLNAFESVWKSNRGDLTTFWGHLDVGRTLSLVDRIWSFGPIKARTNLLFNCIDDYQDRTSIWDGWEQESKRVRDLDGNVISGFRLRCVHGPLCKEPMRGVGFMVEKWTISDEHNDSSSSTVNAASYGPLSGQVISTVKEACRLAFQTQPQRLISAMYSCDIRATTEVLGRVYAVLSKRRGSVISEEMNEGTNVFHVSAVLPVIESFGFCDEIRKKTSGLASPQLMFSHWEVVDMDPFWSPTTEEEVRRFGNKADSENQARRYVNAVRKRKGLSVDEQVVESGSKQRTLNKKK